MTWAAFMIGFVICWFVGWPESVGRHLAKIVLAYRAALNEEG